MPQLFRPPRVTPTPLEPSPPLFPVSMPSPPPPAPAPPVAAEDEERPSPPPMKMKLLLPKAVKFLFGRMNRFWGVALVGLHAMICVVRVLSFTTDPELARFWTRIFRAVLYIAVVLMTCEGIYSYYYIYLPQQEAAAASQLPPPPPEMDMC